MRHMSERSPGDLSLVIEQIDAANAEDPNLIDGQPLAFVQGRAASRWLEQLAPATSSELQLTVRAHHLRRWEIKRADYPEGRKGYLWWRSDNKAHQAASLGALMGANGWSDASIERAQVLLSRTQLRKDPETQLLEDAACLVFLETQFDEMAERTEPGHLVSIVTKTLKKMSPGAISLAASIDLSATAQSILNEAATSLASA